MWPEASGFLKELGLSYIPWQEDWWEECLGFNSDDVWSSRIHGTVVSRQAGKSELAIGRILVGLFQVPTDRFIIYCAHEAATAKEIFLRIKGVLEDPANAELFETSVKHVWQGNGNYGIEMEDGSRVVFKTRTKGTARGFSADLVILDEAMFLSNLFAQSVLPSQLARENPQTIVMGSAGVGDDSEYFGSLRRIALSGEPDDDLTFLEWSIVLCDEYCPDNCDEPEHEKPIGISHDRPVYSEETYARANPSWNVFTNLRGYEVLRKQLTPEGFATECLSVGKWPSELDEYGIIRKEFWKRQGEDDSLAPKGKVVFGITTAMDRSQTSITMAGFTGEDTTDGKPKVLLEVTGNNLGGNDQRAGTSWVVPRAIELWKRHKPYAFVIDAKGQAATFIEDLRDAGVKVISPEALEYAQSCAQVTVGVTGTKNEKPFIFHINQLELNVAVAGVDKRKLAGLWAWARATDASNIIALESATLAFWGLMRESQGRSGRNLWVM